MRLLVVAKVKHLLYKVRLRPPLAQVVQQRRLSRSAHPPQQQHIPPQQRLLNLQYLQIASHKPKRRLRKRIPPIRRLQILLFLRRRKLPQVQIHRPIRIHHRQQPILQRYLPVKIRPPLLPRIQLVAPLPNRPHHIPIRKQPRIQSLHQNLRRTHRYAIAHRHYHLHPRRH